MKHGLPTRRTEREVPAGEAWTQPRDIGTIEWFASPADICRVYASLASLSRQPGLAPVASILEINNGSLNLDRASGAQAGPRAAAQNQASSPSTTWPPPAPASPTW